MDLVKGLLEGLLVVVVAVCHCYEAARVVRFFAWSQEPAYRPTLSNGRAEILFMVVLCFERGEVW